MKRRVNRVYIAMLTAALVGASASRLRGQTVSIPGYTASAPVTVRLSVSGKTRDGKLVGRTDEEVVFSTGSSGQQIRVPVGRVDSVFFDVNPPRSKVNDALAKDNWASAGVLMLPVVRPLLPYLDLPRNNGVDLVFDTADYLLKSTRFWLIAETNAPLSEAAVQRAKSAFALFRALGKASWSELGLVGQARAAEALLALGKRDMADTLIEQMADPFPGDIAMGNYWMVRGRMAYADKDFSAALDGAVRAVCFANKDIDIFPDALLMSARCYEHLGSYYRARDVYYEVGRLFPGTAAGKLALVHLRALRDAGRTTAKEPTPLVNVFFGVQENMNKNVDSLLNTVPAKTSQ